MKLAVMQPYFFPYLGYFQLIHACDTFVFYDDVNFIKNGWINRNRLLLDGEARYFTVPLADASPFAPIDRTRFDVSSVRWKRKMIETFKTAYRRAPHGERAIGLIETAIALETDNLAELARHSVKSTLVALGVERTLRDSSRRYGNDNLSGQARLIDICRRESATTYINAPGGRDLYDQRSFATAGVTLRFLGGSLPPYAQAAATFVPGLSILDVIAWCPQVGIHAMLASYELLPA